MALLVPPITCTSSSVADRIILIASTPTPPPSREYKVLFGQGQSTLSESAKAEIQKASMATTKLMVTSVRVIGQLPKKTTTSRPSSESLVRRRVNAAAAELVRLGVPQQIIETEVVKPGAVAGITVSENSVLIKIEGDEAATANANSAPGADAVTEKAEPPQPSREYEVIFGQGQSTLSESAKAEIQKASMATTKLMVTSVRVIGQLPKKTTSRPASESFLRRRVNAAASELVRLGVPQRIIETEVVEPGTIAGTTVSENSVLIMIEGNAAVAVNENWPPGVDVKEKAESPQPSRSVSFFDRFFWIVAVIAAVLSFFDWYMSPQKRLRIKESVGWLGLNLEELKVAGVIRKASASTDAIMRCIYGGKIFSLKRAASSLVFAVLGVPLAALLMVFLGGGTVGAFVDYINLMMDYIDSLVFVIVGIVPLIGTTIILTILFQMALLVLKHIIEKDSPVSAIFGLIILAGSLLIVEAIVWGGADVAANLVVRHPAVFEMIREEASGDDYRIVMITAAVASIPLMVFISGGIVCAIPFGLFVVFVIYACARRWMMAALSGPGAKIAAAFYNSEKGVLAQLALGGRLWRRSPRKG
jgi:outer membrane protein OmpA-like peptidoglycan-associated protein